MDFSVLLGLVTSGAGLIFGHPRKGGATEAWQTAAETHGLLHKPSTFWSGPKLSGSLSGNELTVDMKNRNTASAATRFRLGMPSLDLGLRLRKKGFWNSFGPRTVIGDGAFDKQVVVESRNQLAAREFLTPERRTAIQSFLSAFKGAVVTDDEISFTKKGYVKKSDEMLGAIDAMMQVAKVLSEETQSTAVGLSEGAAGAAIAATDPADAAAPEPESEPEPEPEREPELPHADQAEVEQIDGPAEEPDKLPEAEAEAEATLTSDSPTSQANTPDAEEFCATVFAPGALSIAANQKFREAYEGETVVWTGTLESVTPFAFDFDFGSGRGIKAVLTIRESEGVASRKVQAVIGLPSGIEGLDGRIGQPVSFMGRLLKVDGFTKRVVVADAELRP